jgi:hypothetical protein
VTKKVDARVTDPELSPGQILRGNVVRQGVSVTRDVGKSGAVVTSNPEMSLVLAVDLNEKKKAIVGIANGDRLKSFSEHWAKRSEFTNGRRERYSKSI